MKKILFNIDDKIYFIKDRTMNKENFINKFSVEKKSYFYYLYSRLYDYIIGQSINLYEEYRIYYSNEYDNFKEFLLEHHNISDNIVEELNNRKSFYKHKNIGNEQPLYCLLQDEETKKIVEEFIGGFIYEN